MSNTQRRFTSPTEDDRLTELALVQCDKILDATDRIIVRAWITGYRAGILAKAPADLPPRPANQPPVPSVSHATTPPQPAAVYEIPTDALPQGWRKVYHNRGEYPCGKPALIIVRPVYADEKSDRELLRYINGKRPGPTDVPLCGSCQEHIDPWSNADLDWQSHTLPPKKQYNMTFSDYQSEPGPDDSGTSADPVLTRHPASVLADMRDEIQRPFRYPDNADGSPVYTVPSVVGSDDAEIEDLKNLKRELGLDSLESEEPIDTSPE